MIIEKIDDYKAKHFGITDRQFERFCGLGNGTLGKWRRGEVKPRMESLEKIAEATKTSLRNWI